MITMKKTIRQSKKGPVAILFMVSMLAFLLFSMNIHAWGSEDNRLKEKAQEADICEKELLREIRGVMSQNGYTNCGVTITKVYDNESDWEYTILLHHYLLENQDDSKIESLMEELDEITFDVENSSLTYQFF